MSEEYKILESVSEQVGVCEYKGMILSFEYKRLQDEGVSYIEEMYQIQVDFDRRLKGVGKRRNAESR